MLHTLSATPTQVCTSSTSMALINGSDGCYALLML